MALRLRIVSEQRRALGQRQNIVFGVGGGSIGRSAENDWVLPDPQRYLSGRHARVHFRHGLYFLEDTSTNGTYLNDAEAPIPKDTPCELHNGDILRIGDYQLVVAIDQSAENTHERTADLSLDATRGGGAVSAEPAESNSQLEGSLDVSLSPSVLFAVEPHSAAEGIAIGNSYGQAVVVPFHSSREPAAGSTPRAENSDIIAARRMARLQRAAAAVPVEANPALDAFCRGAGLDAGELNAAAAAPILQLAGRLLRETLLGLKDLDLSQAEARRQLRLGPANDAAADSVFELSTATDDLLVSLLNSHESRRLDAGQWLRQTFDQLKQHQGASLQAMQVALREFVGQLAPLELEDRFEKTATRNAMGGRPNNWELYADLYRSLVEVAAGAALPHTFLESYARAYEESAKNKGPAAD